MSKAALHDAQWLQSLPQTLGSDFDRYFWSQPDEARAWFNVDAEFDDVGGELSSPPHKSALPEADTCLR